MPISSETHRYLGLLVLALLIVACTFRSQYLDKVAQPGVTCRGCPSSHSFREFPPEHVSYKTEIFLLMYIIC